MPSVVATLALLVAAAYAFIVVAAGLRLVAHGYRPAQFGLSVNSDFNYPRTDQMFIGIVVAVFGAVLVVMVAAAVHGVWSAQVASTLFLGFFVVIGALAVLNPSVSGDPCVDDTYGGGRVCVHPTTHSRVQGAQLGLPAGLAVIGMVGTLRRGVATRRSAGTSGGGFGEVGHEDGQVGAHGIDVGG